MYLDAELSMFQVTKNLFNVTLRIYAEDGSELKFKRWERVSWSTGVNMARASYLSTRASLGARSAREANDGTIPVQEELPFDEE